MTLRDRILAVYGRRPVDKVPFVLDLSHWFYHKNHIPWDLSRSYDQPEYELIECHRRHGAGFYLPNLGAFFSTTYEGEVVSRVSKDTSQASPRITWRYETPVGTIERSRVWEEASYSWGIDSWAIQSEQDIRVLAYALSHRKYAPQWDRYRAWVQAVGELGVVYLPAGYSAIGQLLNYWMGVEGTMYATMDFPETMRSVVDEINENNLTLIDLLAKSPAEIIMMGDNFSSDLQPPSFFERWSKEYYVEAIRRLHRAGKYVAVHIDGRLRGALEMIHQAGADCADAVTPTPMGDLTPEECRDEAGNDFILSGGVSPDLWLENASEEAFAQAVIRWLELRKKSPRLFANAGDQVPPCAVESRIDLMRELVEKYGSY